MNSIPVFRFSKLSLGGGGGGVGIFRTSIRLAHTSSSAPTSAQTPETQSQMPDPRKALPKSNGKVTEKIYVWANQLTRQTVYSFEPRLIERKALRQLPFNGKKTKPTKIRTDYWSQMAAIEIPAGTQDLVWKMLRELRQLHEFSWPSHIVQDEINRRKDEPVKLSKKRLLGRALNNQYGNTVADIAAVLGGVGGKSNILVRGVETYKHTPPREEGSDEEPKSVLRHRPMLLPATVHWANDRDRLYAEKWSHNVKHELLPGAKTLRDEQFRAATEKAQSEQIAKAEAKAKGEELVNSNYDDVVAKHKWSPTEYLVQRQKATETE